MEGKVGQVFWEGKVGQHGQNLLQVTPSLNVNFGDIAGGESAIADWLLTSSLQGKFIEYEATFEHLNDLNIPELSLIDSVNIHELIRKVRVKHPVDDGLPDFLVNDQDDVNFYPDTIYYSDGGSEAITVVTDVTADGEVTLDDLEVQVNVTPVDGWVYFRFDDPADGQFKIKQVLRPDGSEVLLDNVWTSDRTFPRYGRPVYENIFHLFDQDNPEFYTLIYDSDDTVAPKVREIVDVDPDPRDIVVNSVEVIFTEAIKANTFDYNDLSLTLDGGENLITSAIGISQVNANTFRINGLAGITGNIGEYQLTVDATGIEDLTGNAGVGSITENWVFTGDRPGIISLTGIENNLRNTPVKEVEVLFTEPINLNTFDFNDILLTRDDGGNLITADVTITQLTPTRYRLGNLTELTNLDGEYVILVSANQVEDVDGNRGIGGQGFEWTLDSEAPLLESIINLESDRRNTPVQFLEVVFDQPINLESFDDNDISLTVNGGNNLINDTVTITHLSDGVYRISGLETLQTEDGFYNLTVTGSGTEDTAGNSGRGLASETWTLDMTPPDAPENFNIFQIPGGTTQAELATFTVSGNVSETDLTMFLIDATSNTILKQVSLTNTFFSEEVTFEAIGNRRLEVKLVDDFGNSNSSFYDVFVEGLITARSSSDVSNIIGNQSDETLQGTDGNDVLMGGVGNDTVSGKGGDDTLIGIDLYNRTFGVGEIDVFIGGQGKDRFVLGNAATVFYDDGNNTTEGLTDYALIKDFNADEDVIELHWSQFDYRLDVSPINGINGTAIYALKYDEDEPDELIAIIEGVTDLNLGDDSFEYKKPFQLRSNSEFRGGGVLGYEGGLSEDAQFNIVVNKDETIILEFQVIEDKYESYGYPETGILKPVVEVDSLFLKDKPDYRIDFEKNKQVVRREYLISNPPPDNLEQISLAISGGDFWDEVIYGVYVIPPQTNLVALTPTTNPDFSINYGYEVTGRDWNPGVNRVELELYYANGRTLLDRIHFKDNLSLSATFEPVQVSSNDVPLEPYEADTIVAVIDQQMVMSKYCKKRK